MTRYERGRALEYRVRDLLVAHGYLVVRAAGSKGCVDLVALPRIDEAHSGAPRSTLLVQCKVGGVIPPGEWNALLSEALSVSAIPVMARWSPRQPVEFWRLLGEKDGARGRKQPMVQLAFGEPVVEDDLDTVQSTCHHDDELVTP